MKEKKIIILSNTVGAILGFRKHLITFLIEKNYQVYCFATDYTSEKEKQVKELGAMAVQYSLSRGGLNPVNDYKAINQLAKLIREIDPDIVLSSFVKPVIYGTLAAKRAKVKKKIAMLEGLGYYFTVQPEKVSLKTSLVKNIQLLLYKIALPKADLVIFLNNDDPKDLLAEHKIRTKKFAVLGGIGLTLSDYEYSVAPINPVSFIFIGRLLKEKGIFDFLKAAEIVKTKYKEAIFYVIGGFDTENPGALKEEELKYYIEQKIIVYPGHVSNVTEWIKKSSVFVLPSYYREGLPRSTQEAMAMGRAVITTDVPGCRETVIDSKNGFLIPKWSVSELAKKMIYFIESPDEIIKMGNASYQIAKERYDGVVVNQRLLNLIEGL